MHVHPLRRRASSAIPVVLVAALPAVFGGGVATGGVSSKLVRPAVLAGTWSGRYSGAASGRFTLHWKQTGSILKGSITLSSPSGTYSIAGVVKGTAISFGAVGVGATYAGAVSGKTMSGSWKSPVGRGKWSAHKTR